MALIVVLAAGAVHVGRRQHRAVPGRERVLLHAGGARPVPCRAAASSGSTTSGTATSTSHDPTHLEFDYTKLVRRRGRTSRSPRPGRSTRCTSAAAGSRCPRYLAATRPGSRSTVLEIDPAVLNSGATSSGCARRRALQVRIGDARLGIRDEPDDSRDLVVGDAFGSLSVPVAPHHP